MKLIRITAAGTRRRDGERIVHETITAFWFQKENGDVVRDIVVTTSIEQPKTEHKT
jgi:hypothetical protein